MRNPFKKNRGTAQVPDPSRIADQLPMAPEDVTGPMADVVPLVDALFEFCDDHNLTFVGFIAPTAEMALNVVSHGTTGVVHLPLMAGYPPVMPSMVHELGMHVHSVAREFVDEETGRRP
jgi:hypothetical protein